jgi:hypothetical protein
MRLFVAGLVILAAAIGIEFGVLPLFDTPWGPVRWPEARVVALCVILAGCLRGELQALPFSILAAILAGSAGGEGHLGPTMISFAFAGYFAAGASRWFYFDQFTIRYLVVFGVIVLESSLFSFVRHIFWPASPVEIQWAVHAIMALIGAVIYLPLLPWLGRRVAPAEPIGRRKVQVKT